MAKAKSKQSNQKNQQKPIKESLANTLLNLGISQKDVNNFIPLITDINCCKHVSLVEFEGECYICLLADKDSTAGIDDKFIKIGESDIANSDGRYNAQLEVQTIFTEFNADMDEEATLRLFNRYGSIKQSALEFLTSYTLLERMHTMHRKLGVPFYV
jgi:hypothetical protein